MILIDLQKAFDTINHELIIAKLHAYGFDKLSLKLLFSYLTHRSHWTKLNNAFSSWSQLLRGVPQGSDVGPILFNIYLNDIFYLAELTNVCNFADDTTLFSCDLDLSTVFSRIEAALQ